MAVASSSRIECFDTRDWRRLWSVPVELTSDAAGPCAFSANGRWLGVSLNSHDAVLLDAVTGRILARFKPPAPPLVLGVEFNRNDTQLLAATMRGLYVWDLAAVRRELAALGLDWSDERSSPGTAPHR
ncbi:MAG: hypothetical protein HYY24_28295 [Verrucomicrobia bacterium]|nr:hypothetical protein [Verrucomicrobiota bacterium]